MYMTQGLHRGLQQHPDKEAVCFEGKNLTYRELGTRVARLAGALQQLGVERGERVAFLSFNSARYIEYYMAVPWAGAVLNPVNYRWSAGEILYSLDDCATTVLIVDDPFVETAQKMARKCASLRQLIYAGDGETPPGMLNYETLIAQTEPVEDAYRHGDDLAGIFYTGGTTGVPKGVMLSHTNLISSSCNQGLLRTVDSEMRTLHVMPMFHLACFASIVGVFVNGATHVALRSYDPQAMLECVSRDRATHVLLAPTMIQMALEWLERNPEHAAAFDLGHIRSLRYGASPMTPTLLNRTRAAFPNCDFGQGYGMTELAPVATLLTAEDHSEAAMKSGKMYSVGRPVPLVELKIVDAEDREVPRGTVGEIVVRGPNVMLGYWNKPEATTEALRGGWMHTGDGGYMDADGYLFLVDRLKDMIISGGENIYSAEVEKALAGCPVVGQCAVIGVPHEKWGESVHAVIVLKPGASATLESIQSHCRELIAGYKIPRSVDFVDALPMTSVGKIAKNELRARYRKPTPVTA
ncbi:AMP-dependent synthetase [Caballeronia novacaledonica]|uniref:AMP-dependent synthetase n=1 Tax=Caballeronia novacaledonica TaxID=1544861 RepID=A0A2U3I388_9BURK|nr:long-chain-fatty-acid--CoA ligase [Caballeronia novacaledonica]SPB14596.1 AMP-dependent synthetase [Caballeronia novacaledonica]